MDITQVFGKLSWTNYKLQPWHSFKSITCGRNSSWLKSLMWWPAWPGHVTHPGLYFVFSTEKKKHLTVWCQTVWHWWPPCIATPEKPFVESANQCRPFLISKSVDSASSCVKRLHRHSCQLETRKLRKKKLIFILEFVPISEPWDHLIFPVPVVWWSHTPACKGVRCWPGFFCVFFW